MPRPAWSWKDYERQFGKRPEAVDANAPSPSNRDASTGGKPWTPGAAQGNPDPSQANAEAEALDETPSEPARHEGHQREGGDGTPRGGQGAAPAPRSDKPADHSSKVVELTIELTRPAMDHLEGMAAEAGVSAEVLAGELLADVIADDWAAHQAEVA